ncbi:transposase [Streptomyces sp. NPDC004532]
MSIHAGAPAVTRNALGWGKRIPDALRPVAKMDLGRRRSRSVRRGDLANSQWTRLEPLLPKGIKPGRPPVWRRRQLTDGMRWRTRTGAPWRDVPERYGPWDRVYDLFRRRRRDGTWAGIVTRRQAQADANGLIPWDVNVDSTVCRAHQYAAGAAKRGTCERSRRAVLPPNRPTTASGAPGAG